MAKKIISFAVAMLVALSCAIIPVNDAYAKDSDGNIVIALDAGHGSTDPGAPKNGLKESELNWELATMVKAELQTYWGVEVYLTRGSSEWQSNTGRGRTGLAVNADFAMSIHNNSYNESSTGVETYYTLNPSYTQFTKTMATNICTNIASVLGIKNIGAKPRQSSQGEYRDYYTFIDEAVRAGIPAVLVECCYISNPTEAAKIAQAENQKKVATAIATAVAKSFGLSKRGVAAGSTMTLTRTYSATFVSDIIGGTYKSSNESVAKVNSNGIITAVGTGTADITYTGTDGTVQTVHIVVPEVKMVALAAGINPTFYSANENYNPNNVIVKALYSDGSAKQITGYKIGTVEYSANGIYDIPITYNGLTGSLRIYKTSEQNSTKVTIHKPGTNTDIIRYPQVYQSINTGINVTLTPVYSSFTAPAPYLDTPNIPGGSVNPAPTPTQPSTTVAPTTEPSTTVAPTTEAPTTVAPTTEAPTIETPGTDEQTPEESAPVVVEPQETSDDITIIGNEIEAKKSNNWLKIGIIASGALVICAAAACIVVLVIKSKK